MGVQHLSVYHAGEACVVETDIVLPANTALTVAHNLGEVSFPRRRRGFADLLYSPCSMPLSS